MLAPDSPARIDIATDMAIPLISREGFGAVTPAAVARSARCSRQAVHQWFGDQHALRRAVAGRFAARWSRWLTIRTGSHGLPGLLLECDDVGSWCRVWLAMVELAARDEAVGDLVTSLRVREREAVRGALPPSVPVGEAHALLEGLRVQLCHHRPALDFEAACALVDHWLGGAAADGGSSLA